jgi:hypothetical protein
MSTYPPTAAGFYHDEDEKKKLNELMGGQIGFNINF